MADGLRYAIGADTMTLWFDRPTGLLLTNERVTDDPILGDRRTVTWFTRWQAAGGIKLPRQVDTEVNGRLLSHNVVTAAWVNQPVADSLFVIPDSMAARANRGPATPPVVSVTLNELAPGVWRAEGGNHFSLVVDQGATLAVVEAPIGRPRFAAVLDTLKSRFPSKRVTTVVMTHHHWDHSGGIRTALAAGIPIVAHERNRGFVRSIAESRKTVAPDALRGPGGVVVRGVPDSASVGTGASRLMLYALPSMHAEGILAAYLPSARLLFVSDVLSPPAQPGQTLAPAGSAELVAFVRARGLTVDRVVGGHGGVARWADVEEAGGRR
jgi:glyoxylase-like metal-dependent hydrolase (beta-lactamase superfamily II)